ncbi:I78 family peptidase inhibitor [Sulfitobacter sp. PS-8MA]|uniref:I78 family peptidase inhibitor n=1 Tax=Sulfitobacter sp. PS-8MA TaxID=3237707 RepID=UPI0034C6309C
MRVVFLAPFILAGCAPVIPAPLPPAPTAAASATVAQPVPETPAVQTQALEPKPKPKPAPTSSNTPKPKPETSQSKASASDSSAEKPVATGEKVGTCNEGSWWGLIGRPRSAASIVSEPKRVYTEGDPVTTDHRPERTNIVLDAEGKITKVTCG